MSAFIVLSIPRFSKSTSKYSRNRATRFLSLYLIWDLRLSSATGAASVTIGLKRHHPARGRVSAGWRPRSGFNNAVSSMAGAWKWNGWGWVGTRSWAGGWGRVPMSNARACARARVRVASGGSSRTTWEGYFPYRMLVILEEIWAKGQVYVAKNTRKRAKRSFLCVLLVDRSRE